ncbi:hypothetical protein LTR66_006578, partial [Elasticomyces elasticus]
MLHLSHVFRETVRRRATACPYADRVSKQPSSDTATSDLLQRHYTVHGRDNNQEAIPAANGMIPKSAGRTPIACSNCAKTKTKCDKKFPCSRCAGRNLRCTLRPTRRSSKNASRIAVQADGTQVLVAPEQIIAAENQSAPTTIGSTGGNNSPQQLKPQTEVPSSTITTIPEEKPVVEGPPPVFFEQPTSGPTPPAPQINSPLPTPGNGFVQNTPLSGFDDFMRTNQDGSEQGSSPRFMLDWGQMQLPMGYDAIARPDMMMHVEMPFDPAGVPLCPPADGMLTIMPGVANNLGPLITPIETPKVERAFSDLELGSSAAMFQPGRQMSAGSIHDSGVGDLGPIVAAQDAWTVFRCTPTLPSSACPRTAKLNLERLEQTLRNHEGWSHWTPAWDEADFVGGEPLMVMQLHESTRDKLLAITQTFLHKALDIHREGVRTPMSGNSPCSTGSNFVLLPPARVLEYFLRSYSNGFERYYSLTSRGILDANELMHCYNDRASSLLILMMIAQGAMNIPSVEARWLTGGLTEACRISLFDLIEKNIIMSGDPIVLHSALLFTVQAAWSGDKWQMDIAMGQRGMYFAMLRHSGALDDRPVVPSTIDQRANADQLW